MLEAITHAFSRDYTMRANGQEIGSIVQSGWGEKATLALDGYSYTMRRNGVMSGNYRLEMNGQTIADAQKSTWKRNYEISCAEGQFSLRRRSMWNSDYALFVNEQQAGYIIKKSAWKRNAEAELPNVSLAISCFIIWLVLISWQEEQTAAATAAVH